MAPALTKRSHSIEWLFFARGVLAALLLMGLAGCSPKPQLYKLNGQTMGTTWQVTLTAPAGAELTQQQWQDGITSILESVNASMSTYRPESEISRFNRGPLQEWVTVSSDFQQVLGAALTVGRQSRGAYDVTVGPLVNLWGFGPGGSEVEPPPQERINATLQRVGMDKLRVDGENARILKSADVYLDFSSIAKGFAVDQVARWLSGQGVADYLVEIGGEMRVAGLSPRGDAWRVAIEQPQLGQFVIARAIRLENQGVATSGDYRNYFEVDGKRYSHTIDPRTGQPVAHELASVTVVHSSTMMADAWATALTVMGAEEAWSVAQAQGLAVYLIMRDGEGFSSRHTEAFAPLLEDAPATQ